MEVLLGILSFLLICIVISVIVGRIIKGNRTDIEKELEDDEQAAYLAKNERLVDTQSLDEYTSPITGSHVTSQRVTDGLGYDLDLGYEPVDLTEYDKPYTKEN